MREKTMSDFPWNAMLQAQAKFIHFEIPIDSDYKADVEGDKLEIHLDGSSHELRILCRQGRFRNVMRQI